MASSPGVDFGALIVQGAIWATTDLDIVYARGRENHARLAPALADLEAAPIDLPPGVHVQLDARSLAAGNMWTLRTQFGRLDLPGEPAPGIRYETFATRARTIRGEQTYMVASLDDLIVMKRATGRAKDIAHIELLQATAEELVKGENQ